MRARILIVDDEEAIRSLAERVLTDAGFEVICATSAASALRLLQAKEPAHENTAGNVLEKPFTPAELVHAVESVLAPPVETPRPG
jgi:chemotaxis response regulator CheB